MQLVMVGLSHYRIQTMATTAASDEVHDNAHASVPVAMLEWMRDPQRTKAEWKALDAMVQDMGKQVTSRLSGQTSAKRRRAAGTLSDAYPWRLSAALWFLMLDYLYLGDLVPLEQTCRALRDVVLDYAHGRGGKQTVRDRLFPPVLLGTCMDRPWPIHGATPWAHVRKDKLAQFEASAWTEHVLGRVEFTVTTIGGVQSPTDRDFVPPIDLRTCTWRQLHSQLEAAVRTCIGRPCVIPPGHMRASGVCIQPEVDDQRVVVHPAWKSQRQRVEFAWHPQLALGYDDVVHIKLHPSSLSLDVPVSTLDIPVSTRGDMIWLDLMRFLLFRSRLRMGQLGGRGFDNLMVRNPRRTGERALWEFPVQWVDTIGQLKDGPGTSLCVLLSESRYNTDEFEFDVPGHCPHCRVANGVV